MKRPFEWPQNTPTPNIQDYLIDADNDILDFNNPTWQKYINNKYNKDKLSISPMLYEEIKEYADNNLLANAKLFMVVQCPKVDEYADLQRNDFVVHKGFVEYENN